MYIIVSGYPKNYQWLLLSHTGLVMARSDIYKRHQDAMRIGKQIAYRLQIIFKSE